MRYIIVTLLIFGFFSLNADGLKCYSCTLTVAEGEENPDLTCVNNPASVTGKNKITCPERMKYCTIVRNDYISTGGVSSIERNCAETPLSMDDDVVGDVLITHFRTCTTDLCNKGTGIESSGNENQGSGNGMIVDGVGGSAVAIMASSLTLCISLLAAIL